MNLPMNALWMFVAMASMVVLAFYVWTAGSTYLSFPSLVQDAVGYLCIGGAFGFLAMFVAALYDDMQSQERGDFE